MRICSTNCADLITLVHPLDDILSGNVTKQASLSNGLITASNFITGIGTKATYQAKSIVFTPGFRADNGTVFKAEIGGCGN